MGFVCIVDDDTSVRSGLGNLLKSVGYAVLQFSSGEDFLGSSDVDDALCVLLDMKMQGMQGLDVQRQLNATRRDIPVVFMSAQGDDAVIHRAIDDGAVCFLCKPFVEHLLLNAIDRASVRKSSAR